MIACTLGCGLLLAAVPVIIAQEPTPRGPTTPADSARELRDGAYGLWEQFQPRHAREGLTPDVREGLERAREIWIESAAIFERVGDDHARSQVLVSIGGVSVLLHEDEAAWEWNRRGLAAAREADRPDTQASAFSNLSTLLQRRGETRRAATYLDSAYAALAGRGFSEKEAQILVELGDAYGELGEVETAIGQYERALPVLEELGDVAYEARTLYGIGQLYWQLELYDDALEYLEEARPRYVEAGDESGEMTVMWARLAVRTAKTSQLIGRAMASGDCDLRRRALTAIERTTTEDPEQMERLWLRMLQIVRDQQGEEEAERTVGQLRAEWEQGLEQVERRKQSLSRLLEEACGGSNEVGASLEGQLQSALLTLRVARSTNTPLEIARSFYNVGEAYADLSRPDSAQAFYDSALVAIDRAGYGFLRASVLHALGRLHHRVAEPPRLNRAIAYYARAARQRATLRSAAGPDRLRVGAAEQGANLFGDWSAALAARSEDSGALGALAASERGRAQALLDLLVDPTVEAERPGDPGRPGDGQADTLDASDIRRQLGREAEDLLDRLRDVPLLYYQLAADTLFIWAGSIGSGLRLIRVPLSAESTLEYVRRERLPPYYLRKLLPALARDSIASLVGSLRAALGTVAMDRAGEGLERSETVGNEGLDAEAAEAVATGLARHLIPPEALEALPEEGELVIIPYGPLALVPFALLPLPGGGGSDGPIEDADSPSDERRPAGEVERLGDRFALRYAPSLTTLAVLREREGPGLGLGGDRGAAPDSASWRRAVPDALVIGNPEMPTVRHGVHERRLRPLPGAEAEARDIGRRLGVEPLVGRRASEREVRSRLGRATIIHLATHGVAYSAERRARSSFVALAPTRRDARGVARDGARADGRLEVGEILSEGPALRAELVVLSACQTGLGSITESEGTIGFQRAILAKGARSVLVSLWNVSDAATHALMERFYFHWLARGLSKAEALRAAQAEVRRVEEWRDPRYWAAFQVVGVG